MSPTLRDGAPVPRRVWLAGFMAAGKSTVGRLLADSLGWEFVDTDDLVEAKAGRSIPELFEQGEEAFRGLEREAVREAAAEEERVIALGGGALQDEGTRRFIRESGILVYLRVGTEELARRLSTGSSGRPLVRGRQEEGLRERIDELLEKRIVHYESADLVVESGSGRTPESIMKDLRYAIDSRLSADPCGPG
ncbi:MAG: shikimate kinase [bacterium]